MSWAIAVAAPIPAAGCLSSACLCCSGSSHFAECSRSILPFLFFFFNDTATTEIYTLSLHDALPISSRQNTKDQVYAQNEMLAYQQKESTARVASIMENTNLSKQQQVSEIMRQMLTQAQTAGQYFTNDQIKEMTRK